MIRRRFYILFVLCFAVIGSFGQQSASFPVDHHNDQSPYYCRVVGLPTAWGFDNAPGEIERNSVVFTPDGTSWTTLSFRNRAALPLEALALIMEYYDAQGKTIDAIPVVIGTVKGKKGFQIPFHPTGVFDWATPVLPGSDVSVGTEHDATRTAVCPASAKVTFFRARYSDGSVKMLSSPGWRLDPVPSFIPALPKAASADLKAPEELRVTLNISTAGQVTDISPESPAWIQSWIMQDWKFYPALLDGKPTESKLRVLFQIHAERTATFPEHEQELRPVKLVRIFPKLTEYRGWDVYYGMMQEYSTVQ